MKYPLNLGKVLFNDVVESEKINAEFEYLTSPESDVWKFFDESKNEGMVSHVIESKILPKEIKSKLLSIHIYVKDSQECTFEEWVE